MTTSSDWPKPKRGDIVLCRFPYQENPSAPGPTARPALVVDISTTNLVRVCYGTGQVHHNKANLKPHEFAILDGASVRGSGLSEGTKFDLSKIVWLPYDKHWFPPSVSGSNSPRMGNLSGCKSLKPEFFAAMKAAGHVGLLPPGV
jgi:hypothetical protein